MKKTTLNLVLLLTVITTYGNISNFPASRLSNADSLVAYFPFEGNANDESGNGHDGTINGNATLVPDRFNSTDRAFTFPDQSSSISLANSINLNLETGFTINAWIKYKTNNSTKIIVCKHVCGFVNGFLFGIDVDGQIQLWIGNSGWSTVKTNDTFIEDQWYMVTATYDANTSIAKVYVNGEVGGSGSVVYNNFSSNPISIGESYQNNCVAGNMDGAVDEVKIYSRPLSETEILTEYNSSKVGLVAFYPFNGNANDESGNQNNGVVYNVELTNDRYGVADKAYAFNGNDSYIEGINPGINLPTGNSPRTFAAWVKNYVYQYYGSNIFHYGTAQNAPTNFHFLITDVLGLGNGYGYGITYGNINLIDSTWHFVCGTYSDADQIVRLYVDGRLDNSEALPTAPNTILSNNWRIGLFMAGGTPLNGKLDEIRVLNILLSDEEVMDLYLMETTAPVLQQPANQSTVTTLTPLLQWSSSLTIAEFNFQLSTDSLFSSILHEVVTNNFSTQLPDGLLLEGQNYYWRVRSTVNGETGPWSEVWSFNFVNTSIEKQLRNSPFLVITPTLADDLVRVSYIVPATYGNSVPVKLEIINSVGTVKMLIENKDLSPGKYDITVETGCFQPGIYLCRLIAGNSLVVKRLVIVHL